MEELERLLSRAEAAALLNLSRATLDAWAVRGGGPPMIRAGRRVLYRPSDIRAWLDARVYTHVHVRKEE